MQTEIIRIGNSKGIRIPSIILKECAIKDSILLEVKDGKIIISPIDRSRKDWDKKFQVMSKQGDDTQILDENLDTEDWKW